MRMIKVALGLAVAAGLFGGAASAQTVSVYGGGQSQGIAVAPSGEVFYSNFTGDAVSRIPSGGGAATQYVANAGSSPLDVLRSPSGDIYVTYELSGQVMHYPAGCATPCAGTLVGTPASPTWAAMNAAGELYVAAFNTGQITRYPAGCTVACTPTIFATGLSTGPAFGPAGLAFDSAQNLYVAVGDGSIQRFVAGCVAPCTPTAYKTGLSTGIRGITPGEDGSFYLTDVSAGSVLRVPGDGGPVVTYATLPGGSIPRDLQRAADGVIYVAGQNAVYAVSPPEPVPTLTEWAMVLFGLMLAGGAALHLHRRTSLV